MTSKLIAGVVFVVMAMIGVATGATTTTTPATTTTTVKTAFPTSTLASPTPTMYQCYNCNTTNANSGWCNDQFSATAPATVAALATPGATCYGTSCTKTYGQWSGSSVVIRGCDNSRNTAVTCIYVNIAGVGVTQCNCVGNQCNSGRLSAQSSVLVSGVTAVVLLFATWRLY